MITHTHRILIGANGWSHPSWQGDFYPDDLPEDWRLGYYSNVFPVVLLSAEEWQAHARQIPEWLEDSHPDLALVCEAPPILCQGSGPAAVEALHEYIAGLTVLSGHALGVVLPVVATHTGLGDIIANLDTRLPLCIEFRGEASTEAVEAMQAQCIQQGVGWCWHGQGEATGLGHGTLVVTRIAAEGMDMRRLRHIIETILTETTTQQSCVLIIEGHPPRIETIRHAGVILDLF